jgi:hypothetical protein
VESNKQTFTLRDLVDRFTIVLAGEDQIAGQPTYVLAFTPKPNQPYHDETEKVVNQLQGHMWISARTYNVLRTEASLVHPVSIAWFLARIPTLDFHYSTQDTDAGFAASQVQITLQVDAFFVGFHERQTIDMTNFRPRFPDKLPWRHPGLTLVQSRTGFQVESVHSILDLSDINLIPFATFYIKVCKKKAFSVEETCKKLSPVNWKSRHLDRCPSHDRIASDCSGR